jgi:hypothetical protein
VLRNNQSIQRYRFKKQNVTTNMKHKHKKYIKTKIQYGINPMRTSMIMLFPSIAYPLPSIRSSIVVLLFLLVWNDVYDPPHSKGLVMVCHAQSTTLAGYTPSTDVTYASTIDIDQQTIENLLSQMTGAGTGNSSSGGGTNDDSLILEAYNVYQQRLLSLSTVDGENMRDQNGLFFPVFAAFLYYMGQSNYAIDFIRAGYNGTVTISGYFGNFDFAQYNLPGGRTQVIQLGPIILSSVQYIIRNLDVALQLCSDCAMSGGSGNDCGPSLLDEAVAYYVGSIQDTVSTSDAGYMMYATADRLCQSFNTCDGTISSTGQTTSRVNAVIMEQFTNMQQSLQQGQCVDATTNRDTIVQQIFIPFIQGTIRATYFNPNGNGSEFCSADAAMYAAAILPLIFNCSEADAKTIYEHTEPASTVTDSAIVQETFMNNYNCLGLTTDDVGTFAPDVMVDWARCIFSTPAPAVATNPVTVPATTPVGTVKLPSAGPVLAPTLVVPTSKSRSATVTLPFNQMMLICFTILATLITAVTI